MRFVFYSPNFHPLVGGLENVVMDLATELSQLGHSVRVLTLTPANEPDAFPFEVVREAGFWSTVRHVRWGTVFVQINVSLKGILPYLLAGGPLVLSHHNLYPTDSWIGRLKWAVSRQATINMGCSAFIASHYRACHTLDNPYKKDVFMILPEIFRTKDLVFLGRLVSDKGCAVLLQSLAILRQQTGQTPSLTIIGEGPERPLLEKLVVDLELSHQVQFEGVRQGKALARSLNQYQIMVVPSVFEEPFGIVALEGIASGCFVIAAQTGGLPEAVGPCGVTFPMGDANALADVLARALNAPDWRDACLSQAEQHLQKHTPSAVAQRFLSIINTTIG